MIFFRKNIDFLHKRLSNNNLLPYIFLLYITFFTSTNFSHSNNTIINEDSLLISKYIDSANILNEKGIDEYLDGVLDSAEYYFVQSLRIRKQVLDSNDTQLASVLNNIGVILKVSGKYDGALKYYKDAEEIYQLLGSNIDLAEIYINQANVYSLKGNLKQAEQYYLLAFDIIKKTDQVPAQTSYFISNNLGLFYKKIGNDTLALKYFFKSIENLNEISPRYISRTYSYIGNTYSKLGNYGKSVEYHDLALNTINLHSLDNNTWGVTILINYGLSKLHINDFESAKIAFDKAADICLEKYPKVHPRTSLCYTNLGLLYRKQHQYKQSIIYAQKSLIHLTKEFEDTSLYSNPLMEDALSLIKILPSYKEKAYTLRLWAEEQESLNMLQASYETYLIALKTLNKIRQGYINEENKLMLNENQDAIFKNALDVSVSLYEKTGNKKYLASAFQLSEESKASILREGIQGMEAMKYSEMPSKVLDLENELKKQIWIFEELIYEENKKRTQNQNKLAFWNRQLISLHNSYDSLVHKIEVDYPRYHALKYQNQRPDIVQIQKRLNRNEVIVEYSLTDSLLHTFVITPSDILLKSSRIDSLLFYHVTSLREALSINNVTKFKMSDYKNFIESTGFLYQVLLKSVESEIINKELTIIPDNFLAYIPFDILLTEESEITSMNFKNLPFLLKKSSISYNYSSALYFENQNRKRTATDNLITFAPMYENISNIFQSGIQTRQEYREQLFPLMGIIDEANHVSDIMKGDKILKNDATEANFKKLAKNYDIVHLAMHTIIDDQEPMYSKMAFTQNSDTAEDGFLNTFELYNTRLSSRMAVLSSCNTGSGKLQKGEGVMSLARGFFYAGCPSIVMTLWAVEDKSGVGLMISFYKNIKSGYNKSKSLQEAKLEFLENADMLHSHPYFWSSYVVIGSNDNLYSYKLLNLALGLISLGILFLFMKRKYKKWIS